MNSALRLDQLGGDGIDQGAAVVDEDQSLVFDPGEAFADECSGACRIF